MFFTATIMPCDARVVLDSFDSKKLLICNGLKPFELQLKRVCWPLISLGVLSFILSLN
jgi:hypothetical protein